MLLAREKILLCLSGYLMVAGNTSIPAVKRDQQQLSNVPNQLRRVTVPSRAVLRTLRLGWTLRITAQAVLRQCCALPSVPGSGVGSWRDFVLNIFWGCAWTGIQVVDAGLGAAWSNCSLRRGRGYGEEHFLASLEQDHAADG